MSKELKCNFVITETRTLDELVIHPENLKMFPYEKRQLDSVKLLIEESGLKYPIEITEDNKVIDGKHRLYVLDEMGFENIPVVVNKEAKDDESVRMILTITEFSQKDKTPTIRACTAVKMIEERADLTKKSIYQILKTNKASVQRAVKVKEYRPAWFTKLLRGETLLLDRYSKPTNALSTIVEHINSMDRLDDNGISTMLTIEENNEKDFDYYRAKHTVQAINSAHQLLKTHIQQAGDFVEPDKGEYVVRLNELLFEDLSIQEAKTTAIKLVRGLPEVIRLEVIDTLKKD